MGRALCFIMKAGCLVMLLLVVRELAIWSEKRDIKPIVTSFPILLNESAPKIAAEISDNDCQVYLTVDGFTPPERDVLANQQ